MRSRNPQTQEDGYHLLLSRAGDHVDELIEQFESETDHGLRCWLLELVGAARAESALPLLGAQLGNPDDALRDQAVRGLVLLDTREARRMLWRARANGIIE